VAEFSTYLENLAGQVHADGGWGYHSGQPAHLEPTCLALLALALERDRFAELIQRGRQTLSRCRSRDGAYFLERGREEAIWPTAVVLFLQTALSYPPAEIQQTAARLLNLQGRVPNDPESAELVDIDCKLRGWPWADGNFSWAEPTAWACLALAHAGFGNHPRVEEGRRLLLDRASDGGGINYGNRRILGQLTEPLPEPTALMLLALQGPPPHPRITAALAYLQRQTHVHDDLELLCWAKLGLDVYSRQSELRESLPQLDDRIRAAHQTRAQIAWLRPSPMREALTALALATPSLNFFRLADPKLKQSEREEKEETRQSSLRLWKAPRRSSSWPARLKSAFRGILLDGAGRLRQPPPQTPVHIGRVTDYNAALSDVLRRQYEAFRPRVPLAGKRVVLKPNLVEYHRDRVINTNPNVVAAAIELCKHEGATEVLVAEGPGHCRNVEHLVRASGLGDVLTHYGVSFIDLNQDEPVKRLNLGRLTGLDYLYLAQTVATADVLISLPKLKTHHWAGATLAMKNLFGTLPGSCYGWPKNELHWRGIDNSIVDIVLTRPPDLAIVDGIIGMEGDGPLNGTPKTLGALIMGADALAVDATCCRLMQLDPERIGYLAMAQRKKLGVIAEAAIPQLGEPIVDLAQPFETVPHLQPLHLGRSA
jgi:uncharacterized protein (DUF362 family)